VKVPNGYSVFTVLGKRQVRNNTVGSYDSLKTIVRNNLYDQKAEKRLNTILASAAKDYQVKLNYVRLQNVRVAPINMVVKRLIGFGGSMIAVPPIFPLWQWVGETKDVQEILP
jgi:hypothetical protein